ncbi:pantoate--beta-alanine ligase [Mercurialis annua]|uniref:pantoate--beta-alanine ligase n=1 Tax=Mercurialis annua TaxID=3986 RepID=UPI0021609CEA|nr:pantoate--beta-alanine ligase [Mercurialis annua]
MMTASTSGEVQPTRHITPFVHLSVPFRIPTLLIFNPLRLLPYYPNQETSPLIHLIRKKITKMEASKEPIIITEKQKMRNWSRQMRSQGKTIALVPTMGYLHQGHLSLVQQAHTHADLTVVSIYVNPGQFSPSEDLSTYPSDFHGDILKLMSVRGGVDVVFHPHNLYDYGDDDGGEKMRNLEGEKVVNCVEEKGLGHESWVRVERLEKGLCGESRPVFFRGVATVVTKLFNIVEPDFALFGKKDYQQWRIVQRMVRDLDFSIQIIGSEIMRDSDGLALSSRNVHLSTEERTKALSISKSLLKAKLHAEEGRTNCRELRDMVVQTINEAGGKIDYAEIVEQQSLEAVEEIKIPVVFCVAAWFGKVRLIDNIEINMK